MTIFHYVSSPKRFSAFVVGNRSIYANQEKNQKKPAAGKAAAKKAPAKKPVAKKAPAKKAPAKKPAKKTAAPKKPLPKGRRPKKLRRLPKDVVRRSALGFRVNEHIVYPAHGVGLIVEISAQEIAGMNLELFVINFEKENGIARAD